MLGGVEGRGMQVMTVAVRTMSKMHLGSEGPNIEGGLFSLKLDNWGWVIDLLPQWNCILRQVGNDGITELCCPMQLFHSYVFP